MVLDGEVCIFDQALVSQFHLLTDDPDPSAVVTTLMNAVFDCLYRRGRDLRDEALLVRRQAVDATLGDRHMLLFAARRLAADGIEAGGDVERRELEGLVAKHEASRYRGRERSTLWRKIKRRQEGHFLIGGVIKDSAG